MTNFNETLETSTQTHPFLPSGNVSPPQAAVKNPGGHADLIPGVMRIETVSKEDFQLELMDRTHSVYTQEEVYGSFCTVEEYIDCPPEKVFEYMAHPQSLCEWTYSVRDLRPSEVPGVDVGVDRVGGKTKIYSKNVVNREAMTVDYHCAWDQGEDLWMIYLNRIIPAELVLKKPGSVVLWTNCRHPYYNKNPYPALAADRPVWVGDFWDWFYAGHWVEMQNLKKILEYRHKNGLPMTPQVPGHESVQSLSGK
jgi:hypothetical protein